MKKVLDVTCGSRMMWFNKKNPIAVFTDKRKEKIKMCDGRVLNIEPDIEMDFTNLKFEDETFYLVVFDPPHLNKLGQRSWLAQKYGRLLPTWEMDIKEGFNECMRVLKKNGTLIFKWNESQVTLNKVLQVIGKEPLFGHTSGKHGRTIWMTFLKE